MKKQCSKCKKWKLFSKFYKDKRTKDGLRFHCKECSNDQTNKYRQTHIIKCAEQRKKYRQTIIGCLRDRFRQIKRRCINPKCVAYKYYGGRGIKCLFASSDEFINYVLNALKADPCGLDIDRIDNSGHYEPGNIRLVTHKENCNNRRK